MEPIRSDSPARGNVTNASPLAAPPEIDSCRDLSVTVPGAHSADPNKTAAALEHTDATIAAALEQEAMSPASARTLLIAQAIVGHGSSEAEKITADLEQLLGDDPLLASLLHT